MNIDSDPNELRNVLIRLVPDHGEDISRLLNCRSAQATTLVEFVMNHQALEKVIKESDDGDVKKLAAKVFTFLREQLKEDNRRLKQPDRITNSGFLLWLIRRAESTKKRKPVTMRPQEILKIGEWCHTNASWEKKHYEALQRLTRHHIIAPSSQDDERETA